MYPPLVSNVSQNGASMADDLDDAKATVYRDLATIFAIIVGFLSVALSFGGGNTNPYSSDFVGYQHQAIFVATVIMAGLLLWAGGKMLHYDTRVVENKRAKVKNN
jgi:hypothetical protein